MSGRLRSSFVKVAGGRIEEAGSQLLTTSSTLGCPGSWINCARQDQDQDQDQGWTRALEMPRSWSTWIRHAPFARANVRQGPRGSTLIDDASRGSRKHQHELYASRMEYRRVTSKTRHSTTNGGLGPAAYGLSNTRTSIRSDPSSWH